MTCQSLISDLSDVESPSVATARMHLLRRFSRDGPGKLAAQRRRTLCMRRTLKKWVLYVTFLRASR